MLVSRGSSLIRQWIFLKTLALREGSATPADDTGTSSRSRGDLIPPWQSPHLAFTFDAPRALDVGRQYLEPLEVDAVVLTMPPMTPTSSALGAVLPGLNCRQRRSEHSRWTRTV